MGKIDLYFDSLAKSHITGEEVMKTYVGKQRERIYEGVQAQPVETLLMANQHNLITQLVTNGTLESLSIQEDRLIVTDNTTTDTAQRSSQTPYPGRSDPRLQVIIFHLPCTGSEDAWKCAGGSQGYGHQHQAHLENQTITFEIRNRERDVESVQRQAKEMIALIRERLILCTPVIEAYNKSLYATVSHTIESRQQWLRENARIVEEVVSGLRSFLAGEEEQMLNVIS